jgi:hypothetical protein
MQSGITQLCDGCPCGSASQLLCSWSRCTSTTHPALDSAQLCLSLLSLTLQRGHGKNDSYMVTSYTPVPVTHGQLTMGRQNA